MYINSFFLFFLLVNIILTKDLLNYLNFYENFEDNKYLDNITEKIIEYIGIEKESFLNDNNLSKECRIKLNNTIFNKTYNITFYKKIFFYSTFNKNDIHSYYNCINDVIEKEKFKYLTVLIDDKKSIYDVLTSKIDSSGYLVGLCIFDGCTNNDYKNIILKTMNYLNITNLNINNTNDKNNTNTTKNYMDYNKLKNNNNITNENNIIPEIKIYPLNENLSHGIIKFLEYIPFIIILIHLFFIIFKNFPIYFYNFIICIFYCEFKYKIPIKSTKVKSHHILKDKESNKNKGKQDYKTVDSDRNPGSLSIISNIDNFQKSIDLLYNIEKNYSSLIEFKKQSEITNDSGLSYINGIRGISMIFLLFGSVYSNLYSSLIIEKNKTNFYNQIKNVFFSIFYIGIKYAPKLLLCSSGFSLFFKFICFLDGKVENEEEINRQKEESLCSKGKEIQDIRHPSGNFSNSNSFYAKLRKNGEDKIIFNKNYLLSFKYVLFFLGKQLHKYIIYILFISFILFSLNNLVLLIQYPGPIWNFFYENIINSAKDVKYLLPLLIGYKSYLFKGITNENENILDYLYLPFQEIFYFLFSTLIIFIGYKYNLRIDRFLKIIFFILIIFRIIFYFVKNLDDKDYFGYKEFGKFYTSILYNYIFYIFGIHYGMINYVIQKGYSFRECDRQNKIYLIEALRVVKSIKRKNKKNLYIISILFFCILILSSFLQQIIISFYNIENSMNRYKNNIFLHILMIIDTDIFVFSFNMMALFLYIKGDNLINNFLCHNFWSIFNRFYFTYILLINPIILYIIYVNETRIIFNLTNCFLYSFICAISVYSLTIIIYITFELQFKKLLHYWIKLIEKNDMNERLNNIEATYSYSQEQNLLDSATASITDYVGDEEDEDEEN